MKKKQKPRTRDPKRIGRILGLLEKQWKEYPDLRFGQILIALDIIPKDSECFYTPDEETEERLRRAKL